MDTKLIAKLFETLAVDNATFDILIDTGADKMFVRPDSVNVTFDRYDKSKITGIVFVVR